MFGHDQANGSKHLSSKISLVPFPPLREVNHLVARHRMAMLIRATFLRIHEMR
jgi:hypothetical protein